MDDAIEIRHEMYEKISDDIMILGGNAILRMNVVLGKKLEDGTRRSYHSEYMYGSDKYINKSKSISLRRSFDYFMSIENFKPIDGVKEFIMLRLKDMYMVLSKLEECKQWFTSSEFKDLYVIKNKKLIMLGRPDPVIITGLAGDKKIMIAPIVIEYEKDSYEGVRMFLNKDANYVDVNVDNFMAMIYILNRINMFESAQLMLTYLGRPDMGENLYIMNGSDINVVEGDISMKPNVTRVIPSVNQPKRSYFDKINDLE